MLRSASVSWEGFSTNPVEEALEEEESVEHEVLTPSLPQEEEDKSVDVEDGELGDGLAESASEEWLEFEVKYLLANSAIEAPAAMVSRYLAESMSFW
jgi:hypothetical protein